MKRRHAVSLIELLIVMSACSFILTLSASLLHRAMRTQSRARSFFDVERSALRLSQRFRQDVQQARSASTSPANGSDDPFLILRLSDSQTVEYRQQSGVVRRIASEDGTTVSRDEFNFASELEVTVGRHDPPHLFTLSLKTRPSQLNDPFERPLNLHWQARLGRDLRFEKVAE